MKKSWFKQLLKPENLDNFLSILILVLYVPFIIELEKQAKLEVSGSNLFGASFTGFVIGLFISICLAFYHYYQFEEIKGKYFLTDFEFNLKLLFMPIISLSSKIYLLLATNSSPVVFYAVLGFCLPFDFVKFIVSSNYSPYIYARSQYQYNLQQEQAKKQKSVYDDL